MSLKRYVANKDATITNAYKPGNVTRATGSNTGKADSMEVFYLHGNVSTSSKEKSRALVEFPVSQIESDRNNGDIPESGNVDFFIKLSNVSHHETLPVDYSLSIKPISGSWAEGHGVDLDGYGDPGYGASGSGVTWEYANSNSSGLVSWSSSGGDFYSSPTYEHYFDEGHEDVEVNITKLVEQWIDNSSKPNDGVVVKISGSLENGKVSYYTKKFSARKSEFFFQRPHIEARWDSSREDDRNNFIPSSSRLSSNDNLNDVYLYNKVRGTYKDIPDIGTGSIYVKLYETTDKNNELSGASPNYPITGGHVETGIYSASFALDTTASSFHDSWYSGSNEYHLGKIKTDDDAQLSQFDDRARFIVNITNLKPEYYPDEKAFLRVYTRRRKWSPSLYNVATKDTQVDIAENLYYSIKRVSDNYVPVPYGTGSKDHTRLSYDASGSYFEFDMSLLEPDFMYEISLALFENGKLNEIRDKFQFRVIENKE